MKRFFRLALPLALALSVCAGTVPAADEPVSIEQAEQRLREAMALHEANKDAVALGMARLDYAELIGSGAFRRTPATQARFEALGGAAGIAGSVRHYNAEAARVLQDFLNAEVRPGDAWARTQAALALMEAYARLHDRARACLALPHAYMNFPKAKLGSASYRLYPPGTNFRQHLAERQLRLGCEYVM